MKTIIKYFTPSDFEKFKKGLEELKMFNTTEE
jgi:hypothetical protein